MLSGALSDDGFRVSTAADGRSALLQFGMSWPDLVILDIALPNRDGVETLQRLRELSNVPIVVLAGVDEAANIDCLYQGADSYVVRPFSLRELEARVRALLRRSRAKADRGERLAQV